ncbi:MAG: ShlB/FhaC/HecB family hemolysin secretion/activation protein [Burkholderiales bacterium]|nr:ShlB/FhaC/HecB family hemolysin secretion/activation protein [Burkholderiales bacterium]
MSDAQRRFRVLKFQVDCTRGFVDVRRAPIDRPGRDLPRSCGGPDDTGDTCFEAAFRALRCTQKALIKKPGPPLRRRRIPSQGLDRMAFDLPPTPPEASPVTIPLARPAAESIGVESHGYFYNVSGNVFLPRATVVATIAAAATPQAALDALRKEYSAAGYFLVALAAEVNNKLVAVQVINGRITETDMPPHLMPFFRGVEEREDINRNAILRRATIAEGYSARQQMRPVLNFSPAQAYGGSKLGISEEPIPGAKPWNAALGFNNLGSRFSSRYVWQANGAIRPGAGLELNGNYLQGVPGLSSDSAGASYHAGGVGASLATPWGVFGGSYNNISYRIGESSAPLYPEGEIGIGALTGAQLVYADETTRWSVTGSYQHVDNEVNVFDGLFKVTEQHYGYVSLGTTFSKTFSVLGANAGLTAGLTVSQGLSGRAGTFEPALDGVPNPRFTMVQGIVTYAQTLPEGFSATLTANGQYADATVPQNQQWVLGGLGNLSAWLPAVLVGDSGVLTRATVNTRPLEWKGASLTATLFAEAGTVSTYFRLPGAPGDRGLGDVGLSVSGSLPGGTSLLLAYAWPVWYRNIPQSEREDLFRARLFFNLNQSF